MKIYALKLFITNLRSARSIVRILKKQHPGIGAIYVTPKIHARISLECLEQGVHGSPYNQNPYIEGVLIAPLPN